MTDVFTSAARLLQLQDEIESALHLLSMRDDIIRAAYEAGFSKMELHRLTGLARSTIDRIVMPLSPATRAR